VAALSLEDEFDDGAIPVGDAWGARRILLVATPQPLGYKPETLSAD